jgi:CO dehydrogenase nickel-insertion accessory protein CooC1
VAVISEENVQVRQETRRILRRFSQDTEKLVQDAGATYLGKIEPDDRVEEYNLPGKSLLELPDDSPASLSIKKILTRADYGTI